MKVSALIVGFYIALSILGIYKTMELYGEFRENEIAKNNLLNSVKASTLNAQDDFRRSRYEVLADYAESYLLGAIYHSENRILENEKREALAQSYYEVDGDRVLVKKGRTGLGKGGTRREKLSASKNKERNYFYAYKSVYHRKKDCRGRKGEGVRIFSSMEEAAGEGLFPCEDCILRNLKERGKGDY